MKTIKYQEKVFIFKCYFADGAYYKSSDGQSYLLTNSKGEVDVYSQLPLEIRR